MSWGLHTFTCCDCGAPFQDHRNPRWKQPRCPRCRRPGRPRIVIRRPFTANQHTPAYTIRGRNWTQHARFTEDAVRLMLHHCCFEAGDRICCDGHWYRPEGVEGEERQRLVEVRRE